MFIALKKLPITVDIDSIEKAVLTTHPKKNRYKIETIKSIVIVGLEDRFGNLVERHGIIRIWPENNKNQLIKSIACQGVDGLKIHTSEYIIRHWSNDRRQNENALFSKKNKTCRRMIDRRRKGLNLVKITEKSYY